MQDTTLTALQTSILAGVSATQPKSANLIELWGRIGRPNLEDFILDLVDLEERRFLMAEFFETKLADAGRNYLNGIPAVYLINEFTRATSGTGDFAASV